MHKIKEKKHFSQIQHLKIYQRENSKEIYTMYMYIYAHEIEMRPEKNQSKKTNRSQERFCIDLLFSALKNNLLDHFEAHL